MQQIVTDSRLQFRAGVRVRLLEAYEANMIANRAMDPGPYGRNAENETPPIHCRVCSVAIAVPRGDRGVGKRRGVASL